MSAHVTRGGLCASDSAPKSLGVDRVDECSLAVDLHHRQPLAVPPLELLEDVAHEHSDINVRAIIYFLVGLALVTAVAFAAMGALFVVLDSQAAENDPIPSPVAAPATEMRKKEPSPYLGGGTGPKLITREPEVLAGERANVALAGKRSFAARIRNDFPSFFLAK